MMLPSSTYAKTSVLCRCGGTTSPGERTTLSIRPSFPGTSGRSLVIKGVSFASCEFVLLPVSTFVLLSANNRNSNILNVLFISSSLPNLAIVTISVVRLRCSAQSCRACAAHLQAFRAQCELLPAGAQFLRSELVFRYRTIL